MASINVLWWQLDSQSTRESDLVDHTHQVIAALQETIARADDMVIGQRGYALTHEPDFLTPFVTATNRMPKLLRSLNELTRDNPGQQQALARVSVMLARFEQINREHIAALVQGTAAEPDVEFRRRIKQSMDLLRAVIGQMVSDQNALLVQRQESSRRAAHIVTAVNGVAALVSMGLIIGVFAALRRENARRHAYEIELQRSHEELENRVRQRTDSLRQSEAERKRLEQEILEASDNEMHRIGHDLHDGVGQQLTALSLFATGLQKEIETQAPQLASSFQKMSGELRETIRQVRILSHGLSPASLEENGLVEALRKLADDTQSASHVECEFRDRSETRVEDPHVAAQFYRIGQEAVTNALKHSGARTILISLHATPQRTELEVADDGRGFVPASLNGIGGLGLRAMQYRADVIGAAIRIDSAPGKGTRITCTIEKHN